MTDQLMILPPHVLASAAKAKRWKGLYAALPGSGPEGETCGSCGSLYRRQMASDYLKCYLVRDRWTGGGGTDVKARAPACSKWSAKEPAQ